MFDPALSAALKSMPGQKGEVEIVACADPEAEAAFIAERTGKLIAAGVHPAEIIVLVPFNRIARPIGEALAAKRIPVLSYDDEAELEHALARRRFALSALQRITSEIVAEGIEERAGCHGAGSGAIGAARAFNTSGHIPIPRVAATGDPSYSPDRGLPRCLCPVG
jgi:hypothetical protein